MVRRIICVYILIVSHFYSIHNRLIILILYLYSLFQKSILDVMSVSVAADNKTVIQSYMETFPFPFYLLLRDINKLPAVLAEALQQWFELVTSNFD